MGQVHFVWYNFSLDTVCSLAQDQWLYLVNILVNIMGLL